MKPARTFCGCAITLVISPSFIPVHAGNETGSVAAPVTKAQLFFTAGDITDCRTTGWKESPANKTAKLIASHLKPGQEYRILMLGDATYPVGLPGEFEQCYEPTWGHFKQHTYPAAGNHEYFSPLA